MLHYFIYMNNESGTPAKVRELMISDERLDAG